MKELEFYLDGETNGIVALNENEEIISFGKGIVKQSLFKYIDLLKAAIEREKITKYDIAFILNYKKKDQVIIPASKCLKPSPDYYEYFDLENDTVTIICIDNVSAEKIICCGYFTFTDTPNDRITDSEEGKKLSNYCHKAVLECLALEQRKGNISKSEVDHFHSSEVFLTKRRIYGSNISLRVMRGFELVKINQFRKNLEFKVFPFDNNIDKYKNIYFVFTKNNDENLPDKVIYAIMYQMLDKITKDLKDLYPDLLPQNRIINTRQIQV